jgi:glutathione S-transferase
MEPLRIVGRRSSHLTRTVLMFAEEAGVPYEVQPLQDLMSRDVAHYGGNPALKVPNLVTPEGTFFGSSYACRELVRRAPRSLRVLWPEDLTDMRCANAQELTSQAMATEVTLIVSKLSKLDENTGYLHKARKSFANSLRWLNENWIAISHALPARDISFLEVSLFCLITHIEFRNVMPVAEFTQLQAFCEAYGERASAKNTTYRFDVPG